MASINKLKIPALLFLISAWFNPLAQAQVVVTKAAGGKAGIDTSSLQAGGTIAAGVKQVLESDLIRSGGFSLSPRGQGDVRLIGTVEEKGSELVVRLRVVNTALGKSYLSKAYRQPATQARRLAHVIADEIVKSVLGETGIASSRMIMIGDRTGHKELYVCDYDGQGLIQITPDRSVSVAPEWSPDGENIVYTSYIKGYPDIYQINLASGDRDRLAGYPGLNTGGAISPDSKKLAMILSKDGNPELYVKNLRSGQLIRLTRTGRANESSPSWSPDGKRLVYVSDSSGRPQLYILAVSGGQPKRLTARGSENVAPDWGANGLIAYTRRIGGRYQIMVMNPDTLDTRQVTSGFVNWEDPSWAPNGRHIVCSRTESGRSRVYILDTRGDSPIPLTNSAGNWFSPAWSPR